MRWFKRFMASLFKDSLTEVDAGLRQGMNDIKTLRGHLLAMHDEIDMAIKGCDMLLISAGKARERIKEHKAQSTIEPTMFDLDKRQR